jgi:hypothetical protein
VVQRFVLRGCLSALCRIHANDLFIAKRFRDLMPLRRAQKLFPHLGEAGTAIFAVQEVEYGGHDLSKANTKAGRSARFRAMTHCKHGHPLSGDNLYLYVSHGRHERKCLTCHKRLAETGRRTSEHQARGVVEALNQGMTIVQITKTGPSYILNATAGTPLFRKKHPKFDRLVMQRSRANAKVHLAEAGARRAQAHRLPSIADHGSDIFLMISAAVPTTLPAQIRDDVIGAMGLAIVEGKLRPTDIRRRVREYVTLQFRQFSKYGPASLEARLSEDGNATLLDRLSTDVGTGYWDVNMMASTGRQK